MATAQKDKPIDSPVLVYVVVWVGFISGALVASAGG